MTDTAATPAKSGIRISGAFHRLLAFSGLIALVVVFSLASPNFMQTQNVLAILQATSVNGVLAIAAVALVPWIGPLVSLVAMLAGMGAIVLGLFPAPATSGRAASP